MKKLIIGLCAVLIATNVASAQMTEVQRQTLIQLLWKQVVALQEQLNELIEKQKVVYKPEIIFYVNGTWIEEKDGLAVTSIKYGNNKIKVYLKGADHDNTTCDITQTDKSDIKGMKGRFELFNGMPSYSVGFTAINVFCQDKEGRTAEGRLRLNVTK